MPDQDNHIHLPAPPVKLTVTALNLLILVGAVAATWWFTKQSNEKYMQALNETNTAHFQKLENHVAQLQGSVVTTGELEKKVRESMGPEFTRFVNQQNGTLTNLAVAIGELRGAITTLKPPVSGTKTEDGGFKDVNLAQNRDGAPSLTGVRLSYDPKQPGFGGLTGQWINNAERFTASYGSWRTEHDGMRSAVKLKREVTGPDGKKVGEEDIPLVNGDSFFSTDMIARTAPTPKYTFMFGASYDNATGKKRTSALVGQQLTPTWGLATGYVNNGWVVMSTYRFGEKK